MPGKPCGDFPVYGTGMDVHKEAISIEVLSSSGELVMECIIETKASAILQFFQGLPPSIVKLLERSELDGRFHLSGCILVRRPWPGQKRVRHLFR